VGGPPLSKVEYFMLSLFFMFRFLRPELHVENGRPLGRSVFYFFHFL